MNINGLLKALPIAGIGMLGVFVVIIAIFLSVKLLGVLFKDKEQNQ